MTRQLTHKTFNKSQDIRARKDAIISRIEALIRANRLTPKIMAGFDPSLRPCEISWILSDVIGRFGVPKLERIENSILAGLDLRAAA